MERQKTLACMLPDPPGKQEYTPASIYFKVKDGKHENNE